MPFPIFKKGSSNELSRVHHLPRTLPAGSIKQQLISFFRDAKGPRMASPNACLNQDYGIDSMYSMRAYQMPERIMSTIFTVVDTNPDNKRLAHERDQALERKAVAMRKIACERTARAAAEDQVASLQTRLEIVEQRRVEAELRRLRAEQGIAEADRLRALAEHNKADAEQKRLLVEQAVATAEQKRVLAEQGIADAEHRQMIAEHKRNMAEHKQALAEQAWHDAERRRAEAEYNRELAEHTCAMAELGWQATEQERDDAKHQRALAEKERDNAEVQLILAKHSLEDAEQQRMKAESVSEAAEQALNDAKFGRSLEGQKRALAEVAWHDAEHGWNEATEQIHHLNNKASTLRTHLHVSERARDSAERALELSEKGFNAAQRNIQIEGTVHHSNTGGTIGQDDLDAQISAVEKELQKEQQMRRVEALRGDQLWIRLVAQERRLQQLLERQGQVKGEVVETADEEADFDGAIDGYQYEHVCRNLALSTVAQDISPAA